MLYMGIDIITEEKASMSSNRGYDLWTVVQIESHMGRVNQDLEILEQEQDILARKIALKRKEYQVCEDELSERFEKAGRDEKVYYDEGVCEHGYAQACRACDPDGK